MSAYEGKNFAPMNACWGLLPPLEGERVRDKRERGAKMAERGLAVFDQFVAANIAMDGDDTPLEIK